MTLEEIKKISDEELRIKVAELCGWKPEVDRRDLTCICTIWTKNGKVASSSGHLPDYPQDLNAMHEAEELLQLCNDPECKHDECGKGTWGFYTRTLDEVVDDNFQKGGSWGVSYSATARQRAEAFVLTMIATEDRKHEAE